MAEMSSLLLPIQTSGRSCSGKSSSVCALFACRIGSLDVIRPKYGKNIIHYQAQSDDCRQRVKSSKGAA